MPVTVIPYDTPWVNAPRQGGTDAYGNPPERAVVQSPTALCRHCLKMIPKGHEMLAAAACPFPTKLPYAEMGPIFFCAKDCAPYEGSDMPSALFAFEDRLLKGYTADHRILYGTGTIVPVDKIAATCDDIFQDANVAFVDIRSARNNCFSFRVTRGDDAPDR